MRRPELAIEHAGETRRRAAKAEILILMATSRVRVVLDADAQCVASTERDVATPEVPQDRAWIVVVARNAPLVFQSVELGCGSCIATVRTADHRHIPDHHEALRAGVMCRVSGRKAGIRKDIVVEEEHDLFTRRLEAGLAR